VDPASRSLDAPPRYEPIRSLGAGGGGEVWEVRDRLTNARLALKVLGGRAGQREADALVREVVALAGLEGLGLPRILLLGRLPKSDRLFVLRELVDGDSLDQRCSRDPIGAMAAMVEAACQLTVLHRGGLLHGDIKPANIILRANGGVTLVDLGLAAEWREGGVVPEGLTPRYAAPELMHGRPLTVRSEIFSLGFILGELLELCADRLDAPKRESLQAIVRRATDIDPMARHPSADEFASELHLALGLAAQSDRPPVAFVWPIRGIDAAGAKLLGIVAKLAPKKGLRIEGEPGSGRSLLLRRLAFSLGIAAQPLVMLDEVTAGVAEAALAEIDAVAHPSDCFYLVDDSERLSPDVVARLGQLSERGARIVWVGACELTKDFESFVVAPLDRETVIELMRGAIPSVTEELLVRVIEVAKGRPGPLRLIATRVAQAAVASPDDLDRLLDESSEQAALPNQPWQRGMVLLDRGRYRDAQRLLDETSNLSGAADLEWRLLRARLALGLGEAQKALTILLESPEADRLDPKSHLGCLYAVNLARSQVGVGNYVEAIRLAEQVTDPATTEGIEAMLQAATAYRHLGRATEASRWLDAARTAAERLGEPRVLAMLDLTTGLLAQHEDRLQDALVAYQSALRSGQKANDAGLLATAQLNLAGILKIRGDLAGAIEHFEAALDLGQRIGRSTTVRNALLNLANLDLYLGRLARARARIDELAAERGALTSRVEAQLRGVEADLYAQSGNVEKALERYDACAAAYESLSRNADAAEALLEGVLVAARAPSADPSALRVRLERAKTILGDALAHRTLLQLAQGRLATIGGDETAARTNIDRAIGSARENNQKEWLWRALEARSELEMRVGRRLRARRDREEALSVIEEIGAELPRDLREVYWNDVRRSALRGLVASGEQVMSQGIEPPGLRPVTTNPDLSRDVSTMLSTPLEMRLARILEINSELAGELDLERLTQRIVGHAVRIVRAERGLVLLRDEQQRLSIYCERASGEAEQHLRFSTTVAETVVATGEPVVSLNACEDARMSGWGSVHELMLQSVACVPIRARNKQCIGALYVETRLGRGNEFLTEAPMLQAFADQVAIAIQNARLVQENQNRANDLTEVNKKLLEAQSRLEELLGNRTAQLERTRRKLRETRDTLLGHFGYHGLVGTSAAMRRVYSLIERVKDTDVPVLITGESGTGKEMVARAIHETSPRAKRRFVGVNCGAIPENLLESELFGCVRGAFTGADRDRRGLFRESEGGSILLDEIGEMPHKMQASLLRVLQERTVRPVGGTVEEPVDVRLVFATNRDLHALVDEKKFREDLYYRIHVVEVHIPPLRERAEDIPQLVDHFLGIFAARHRREKGTISRDALRLLTVQPWRGNVRELEHVLLNVWVMSDAEELTAEDFEVVLGRAGSAVSEARRPSSSPDPGGRVSPEMAGERRSMGLSSTEEERQQILKALADCGQNRVKAAQVLGIPRRTFYRRLNEYGIG
jgi:serine/threonine-protein kinase PknK